MKRNLPSKDKSTELEHPSAEETALRVDKAEDAPSVQPAYVSKKKKGTVENITDTWITINVNGNGERIPFDAKVHKDLKKGDPIEF